MSQEDIIALVEEMMKKLFKDVAGITLSDGKFNRMTYEEAMNTYGSDKPDLRYGMGFTDITDCVKDSTFKVFSGSKMVKGIKISSGDRISNSRLKNKGDIFQRAQEAGAPGLIPLRVTEDGSLQGAKAVMEGLTDLHTKTILDMTGAQQVCSSSSI